LAGAGAALLVTWLAVALVAAASSDDVCADRAPADATVVSQRVNYWLPTVGCRYATSRGVVVTRQDGEARLRLAAIAVSGLLAVAAWLVIAYRVVRSEPRRPPRTVR